MSEQEIRSGGFDARRLAAAWCFVNTNSYEDCVLAAVNLGDDRQYRSRRRLPAGTAYVSTQFRRSG
ncbi:MAG: hypothetical protein ACLU0O_10470 [Collinsella sp.]